MDDFSKRFLFWLRIKQVIGIVLSVIVCVVTYVIVVTDIPNEYLMPSVTAMVLIPVYTWTVTVIRRAIIKHFERKGVDVSSK